MALFCLFSKMSMQSRTCQSCSQVAALLYKHEDLKRQQGFAAIPEDITCTGTLQQWHVPPKQGVQAAAVKDITFPKAHYERTPIKKLTHCTENLKS